MTMIFSLVLGFVLGVAALVFAFQNNETVALSFLNWQFESPLAVVTLLAVLVGILIYALLSLPSAIQSAISMQSLKSENKRLRAEGSVETTAVVREETVYPTMS